MPRGPLWALPGPSQGPQLFRPQTPIASPRRREPGKAQSPPLGSAYECWRDAVRRGCGETHRGDLFSRGGSRGQMPTGCEAVGHRSPADPSSGTGFPASHSWTQFELQAAHRAWQTDSCRRTREQASSSTVRSQEDFSRNAANRSGCKAGVSLSPTGFFAGGHAFLPLHPPLFLLHVPTAGNCPGLFNENNHHRRPLPTTTTTTCQPHGQLLWQTRC